jgi:hypothetical protein
MVDTIRAKMTAKQWNQTGPDGPISVYLQYGVVSEKHRKWLLCYIQTEQQWLVGQIYQQERQRQMSRGDQHGYQYNEQDARDLANWKEVVKEMVAKEAPLSTVQELMISGCDPTPSEAVVVGSDFPFIKKVAEIMEVKVIINEL